MTLCFIKYKYNSHKIFCSGFHSLFIACLALLDHIKAIVCLIENSNSNFILKNRIKNAGSQFMSFLVFLIRIVLIDSLGLVDVVQSHFSRMNLV